MNGIYWKKFYENFKIRTPSDFAQFCLGYFVKHDIKWLIDVGCGNGRDSYYFSRNGIKVIGVDLSSSPKNSELATFIKASFDHYNEFNLPVYARFFLHSISDHEILHFIKMAQNYIFLEFRDKEDEPILFKHERNKVDSNIILKLLLRNKFDILYFNKSKGLAKLDGENPLICRIIAKK